MKMIMMMDVAVKDRLTSIVNKLEGFTDSIMGELNELQTFAVGANLDANDMVRIIKEIKWMRKKLFSIKDNLNELKKDIIFGIKPVDNIKVELFSIRDDLANIRGKINGLRKYVLSFK